MERGAGDLGKIYGRTDKISSVYVDSASEAGSENVRVQIASCVKER